MPAASRRSAMAKKSRSAQKATKPAGSRTAVVTSCTRSKERATSGRTHWSAPRSETSGGGQFGSSNGCPSEVEYSGSGAVLLRGIAPLCGTIKASKYSGISYETTSYLRVFRAAVDPLVNRRSRLGCQQGDGPAADPGPATAGANDRHAAQLRRAHGRDAEPG